MSNHPDPTPNFSKRLRQEFMSLQYKRIAAWSWSKREAWFEKFPSDRERVTAYRKEMGWRDGEDDIHTEG
jgi:hypothetical protein